MRILKALVLALALCLNAGCQSTPLQENAAVASVEAFYTYQQATSVMLAYRDGEDKIHPVGTGGVIGYTDEGKLLILTARHCINDFLIQPNFHMMVIKDDAMVDAEILSDWMPYFSETQDYGFIAIPDGVLNVKVNKVAHRDPVLGEKVYASPMFPWMGVPTTLEGRVASISPDKSLMIIQIQGYYGMSGSNVVSANGEVIGVLIAVQVHGTEHTPIGGTSLCVVVRVK